ncbi:MAG: heat-inducible transcription repressor HrcA [Clostridia bacterium]|nr:heat-inducible transcription repressor HrcA [Clostridia bacterium]
MELSERKLKILLAIVDDYIATGTPIGSRTLSRMWGGAYSPATIRNEMSDLEEMGLLQQPHTSAGRIPSDLAYRLYVDRFLNVPRLTDQEAQTIRSYYRFRMGEIEDVMAATAHVLSQMTDYVGMILAPQLDNVTVSQIRVIPVTRGRALAVLVTSEGIVKDMFFQIPPNMDDRHLEMMSNALTDLMRGKSLDEFSVACEKLKEELGVGAEVFDALLGTVRKSTAPVRSVVFDGHQNLFKHPEYSNVERARTFLATIDSRDVFYNMLSQTNNMEITISIGRENEHESLQDSSVVTATYRIGGHSVGSFGVVGPTRMDYARVLSVMEQISAALNEILSGSEV